MYEVIRDKEKWQHILEQFPPAQQDIYFTPAYYALYEALGEGQAVGFYLESPAGKGFYPFLLQKVAYGNAAYYDIEGCYGYNGSLFAVKEASFYKEFYTAFADYCAKQNIIAEFTRFHPLLKNETAAQDYMTVIYDRPTVFVDLEQPLETLWKQEFSGTNRNMIRKAERAGVVVEQAQTKEAFEQFHGLYEQTMKDLSAADFYFFPLSYFLQIQASLPEAYVYQALLEGELVGAILVLEYGDYAHYHLSARNRAHAKLAANNLLLYTAMQAAQERGRKGFHLGGGSTNDPKNSLLKFKMNFSSQRGAFHIGKKVHHPAAYQAVLEQWREEKNIDPAQESKNVLRYKANA